MVLTPAFDLICWWVEDSQRKQEMQVSASLSQQDTAKEPACPADQAEAGGALLCPKGTQSWECSPALEGIREGTAQPRRATGLECWLRHLLESHPWPLLDRPSDI